MSILNLPVYTKRIPVKNYNKVVLEYLPLIRLLASRIYNRAPFFNGSIQDLVNEGVIGMLDALRKYKGGVQLGSYVFIRINGQILDYIRGTQGLSRYVLKTLRELHKVKLNRNNSVELHVQAGITKERLEYVNDLYNFHKAYKELLEDHEFNLFETVADKMLIDLLLKKINKLTPRRKEIMLMYYTQDLTDGDIAKILKCNIPNVSQIRHESKKVLREYFNKGVFV